MLTEGIPVELRSTKGVFRITNWKEDEYEYFDAQNDKLLLRVNRNVHMCEFTETQIDNLKKAGNEDRTLDTCPAITLEEIDMLTKEGTD